MHILIIAYLKLMILYIEITKVLAPFLLIGGMSYDRNE